MDKGMLTKSLETREYFFKDDEMTKNLLERVKAIEVLMFVVERPFH